jgi:transmembrane sensor
MSLQEIDKLLDRYLLGTASADEKLLVEQWLEENDTHQNDWKSMDEQSKKVWLSDLYQDIHQSLNQKKDKAPLSQIKFLRIVAATAAILAIVLGVSVLINKEQGVKNIQELAVNKGEQRFVELSDGTQVWLNSGSILKVDIDFNKDNRKVYLTGEAYFEVTHNANKPFVVYTEKLSTKVLGTRFNIRAYETEEEIKVALISGSVELSEDGELSENKIILKPKEVAAYKKNKHSLEVVNTEKIEPFVEWKSKKIDFSETPLEEVVKQLESVYHVKISLENPNLSQCKITGSFEAKHGISEILNSIALSVDGKYEWNEDELKLSGIGCN